MSTKFETSHAIQETMEGEVARVRRFDDGYTILTLKVSAHKEVTLVGIMPILSEGMSISANVTPANHAKYGIQYRVVDIHETGFNSVPAIVNYLSGPAFPGIGPAFARSLVAHFGMDTLKILDANPDRVFEVPNAAKSKCQILRDKWTESRVEHKLMTELMGLGMTVSMAMKVHKHFGDNVLSLLKDNYYGLIVIPGIGFLKADEIALKNGVGKQEPKRIQAAIIYNMEKYLQGGDCFQYTHKLIIDTSKLLENEVDVLQINEALKKLEICGKIVIEDNMVYEHHVYFSENLVVEKIKEMLQYNTEPIFDSIGALRGVITQMKVCEGITLAPEQEEAIMTAMNSRVVIITGGPGTGKSMLTKAIFQLFDIFGITYCLCSPTGRAAKRLQEATGRPASTIHRLLAYNPFEGFTFNENNPLFTNCVLVDEMSMVDIMLFRHLLSAMETNDRLIMIGDADQLPSVGPGNVLRDLIASETIPTVKLQRIFRQAEGSSIIVAAHDILHGDVPALLTPLESGGKSNFMFVGADDPATLIDLIITLITKPECLPHLGYKPEDIQVLTPMREKGLGINDLNPELQKVINPPHPDKTESHSGMRIFREGDRVMQIRNDYNKGVFNGEMGTVSIIHKDYDEKTTMTVNYPDIADPVKYESHEWDDLLHAYALTIHKSQGGEFPVVIQICHQSQYNMLQRNLLYTGVTRAKKLCIIAGSKQMVKHAVENNQEIKRNTRLSVLLKRSK